ncbi:MAG: arabinogalactan endo-1,4-beta-galactosidase [Prevotella sp.]|nr:arabinogalactan endo-1,4-beta-galactosidase [Prevotella sp.]
MRNGLLIILAVFFAPLAGFADEPQTPCDFAKGADISWVTEMESTGARFFTTDGTETDCFVLMKQLGLNAIRLRVWVDPAEHGNWCNKTDLLDKAKRTARAGMDVMIDFHYSDWWADPSHQTTPAAWRNCTYEEMKQAVAEHTKDILQALKDEGITPRWVQVGNETSNGFLWPMGDAKQHPEQYAGLFAAGYEAVKTIFPDAIVIVHLDNGYDPELYDWNLGALLAGGAKFDMIGMSLYPYWAHLTDSNRTADATITDCIANIKRVAERFGCDVMIAETGMECADEQGRLASDAVLNEGKAQLVRIIKECRDNTGGHCKGVFYWEPECRPGAYRLGAFTEDGKPTVIMDAFKE